MGRSVSPLPESEPMTHLLPIKGNERGSMTQLRKVRQRLAGIHLLWRGRHHSRSLTPLDRYAENATTEEHRYNDTGWDSEGPRPAECQAPSHASSLQPEGQQ